MGMLVDACGCLWMLAGVVRIARVSRFWSEGGEKREEKKKRIN